jgi:hypothetical protein
MKAAGYGRKSFIVLVRGGEVERRLEKSDIDFQLDLLCLPD